MKKQFCLILSILLMFICFVSCNSSDNLFDTFTESPPGMTTPLSTSSYITPDDEKEIIRILTTSMDSGIKMEVTLHGYQSESLNKDFYVKSNEYFIVDVKIINDTLAPGAICQHLPTACRDFNPPHNHELGFYFANRYGDKLASSSDHRGFVHPEVGEIWELKTGESECYTLKLAAGKNVFDSNEKFDLPIDGVGGGIELYDESIYKNGSCLFIGFIYFPFSYNNNGMQTRNNTYIVTEISFEVVYVSNYVNS